MRTQELRIGSAAALALLALACTSPAPSHLPAEGAMGPYSAAVGGGNVVFLSGKIGKTGGSLGQDVEAAIDSIEGDLRRLDLSLADVVSVNVFLTDIAGYAEMNAAYGKRFPEPYPARTTVAVTALPGGSRVEIQAVALRRR